jgi:alpha-galactosidase
MMKKNGYLSILGACGISFFTVQSISALDVTSGKFRLEINESTGKANIYVDGTQIIKESVCGFRNGSTTYYQDRLTNRNIAQSDITDEFGTGKKVTIVSVTSDNTIKVVHDYFLYEDYILTKFAIESDNELVSNYMAPVWTESEIGFLPSSDNRYLYVPFDNDGFVDYGSMEFASGEATATTSYEVGAFYNETTGKGLVLGSVEHTHWKTGVAVHLKNGNQMAKYDVYGGITSNETRDKNTSGEISAHGSLRGKRIQSPKIFIGYFDDWRTGMETYADVNAIIAPKAAWEGTKPFGWNSWGVIQTAINYEKTNLVSQYIDENLKDFSSDVVWINLDSGWGNLSESEIKLLLRNFRGRNQKLGLYFDPFIFWGNDPDNWGNMNGYPYSEVCLKANGKYISFDGGICMDPTHPAVKQRIQGAINNMKTLGIEYLKIDFLSHGSVEADRYYDADVHTGIEAYNQGMKYIYDCAGGKIYLNESIAPLFPANYAQSRRISCDAWYSVGDTKYVLNSLTYGWWLDHVYRYNDADHVVLRSTSGGGDDAENRSRITSSVITGIFILGDDFSNGSSASSSKERAQKYLTKPEVNRVARQCKAFRPLGSSAPGRGNAAGLFYTAVADTTYVAAFNYSVTGTARRLVDFDKLGLRTGTEYSVKELWSGTQIKRSASWNENVPSKDVKLLKIYRESSSNVEKAAGFNPKACILNGQLYVESDTPAKVTVYDVSGKSVAFAGNVTAQFVGNRLERGVYFAEIESGRDRKVIKTGF